MKKFIAFTLMFLSTYTFSFNQNIKKISTETESITELESHEQLEAYKQIFLKQNNILYKKTISLLIKTSILKNYWEEQLNGFKVNPIKYFKKDNYKKKIKQLKEKKDLYLQLLGEIVEQRKNISLLDTTNEELQKFLLKELSKLNPEGNSLDGNDLKALCKNNINFLINYKNYEKNQFKNLEKPRPYLKYITISTASILGIILLKNIKTPVLNLKRIFQEPMQNPIISNIAPIDNPNLLARELADSRRNLGRIVLNHDNYGNPFGSISIDPSIINSGEILNQSQEEEANINALAQDIERVMTELFAEHAELIQRPYWNFVNGNLARMYIIKIEYYFYRLILGANEIGNSPIERANTEINNFNVNVLSKINRMLNYNDKLKTAIPDIAKLSTIAGVIFAGLITAYIIKKHKEKKEKLTLKENIKKHFIKIEKLLIKLSEEANLKYIVKLYYYLDSLERYLSKMPKKLKKEFLKDIESLKSEKLSFNQKLNTVGMMYRYYPILAI